MRSPEQALELLRGHWRRRVSDWLTGAGEWPLRIALAAPGERQASADWPGFESWRERWRAFAGAAEVIWAERRWPLLGIQAVPNAWLLPDADAVARALGESLRWQHARARYREWTERWPALAGVLSRQFELLADTDEAEFTRLADMLAWLQSHPDSRLFVRQLPVGGLDSKWLEARRGLLGEWLRALAGAPVKSDFWQLSGLRRESDRLRLRVLDPALRAQVGGLGDIQAPFEQLANLRWSVPRAFIVENKQTGLAFTDVPGVVVLMARGYAVDALARLPWLRDAQSVHYWGDLDTHGLAILGRLRGYLPRVQSLLMDDATLLAHRALWVVEPVPHGAGGIENLDQAEQALYRDLRADRWGVRVRLEQERIGWEYAWAQIEGAD